MKKGLNFKSTKFNVVNLRNVMKPSSFGASRSESLRNAINEEKNANKWQKIK